jgi:lysophospholipase L1-like esterase
MQKTTFVSFVALVFFNITAMIAQTPTRVIFFGDSITELGVTPDGYITKIREGLTRKGIGSQFELIGAGLSGNKIYDLYLRLDEDVLNKNPKVVVIYVGVNDVWHKMLTGTGTDPDKFEKFYTAIIKRLLEKHIRVILCTPAAIGERTDNSNQQDGDLNLYSQIIRQLAAKYQCQLCDLRKAFLEHNLKNNRDNVAAGILTTDRVHLNQAGNQLVAELVLTKLLGH